jgi:hypothetical protein
VRGSGLGGYVLVLCLWLGGAGPKVNEAMVAGAVGAVGAESSPVQLGGERVYWYWYRQTMATTVLGRCFWPSLARVVVCDWACASGTATVDMKPVPCACASTMRMRTRRKSISAAP